MDHPLPKNAISMATAVPSFAEDLIGCELMGRYYVESRVGAGGFGIVYCAWDMQRRRPVAIKVLREEFFGRKAQRVRFEREAEALVGLAHPHIVSVTDYGVDGQLPFLVMELLQGLTLDVELKRQGALPVSRCFALAGELLAGLTYIHSHGLVHRDVKPANIFLHRTLGGGEQLKLLDFGLAKFLEPARPHPDSESLTRSGDVFGTPGYMPPEQLASEEVDRRGDVYSAAVVFYEMLAGRRPFVGAAHEVLRMVLVEPAPPLRCACPARHAHPDLERALLRAMAKSPGNRFPDAASFAAALTKVPRPGVFDRKGVGRHPFPDPGAGNAERAAGSAEAADHRAAGAAAVAWLRRRRLHFRMTASPMVLACLGLTAVAVAVVSSGEPRPPATGLLPGGGDHDRRGDEIERPPSVLRSHRGSLAPEKPVRAGVSAKRNGATILPPGVPPISRRYGAGGERPASAEAVKAASSDRASPSESPWSTECPRPLRSIRRELHKGARGSDRTIARLQHYNRTHPEDPRGHLLLARLFQNRGAMKNAVSAYRTAFKRDPSARADPAMLRDLRRLASLASTEQAATRLLRRAYGSEALAGVAVPPPSVGDPRDTRQRVRRALSF